MKKEIYKDVPGYEGLYQVSNIGNVMSFKNGRHGLKTTGKLLKPQIDNYGYYKVMLCVDKTVRNFKIHQLVAMAFLGHKPDGYKITVDHIDKNPLNNNVNNLQLLTSTQHFTKDKLGTGLGCCFVKKRNNWRAEIGINYKNIYLGSFSTKEEASAMYQKALKNKHLYNGDNKEFRNKLKYAI